MEEYLLCPWAGFHLLFLLFLGCYGVPPAKASEEWMCSRCSANALEEVSIPCFSHLLQKIGVALGLASSQAGHNLCPQQLA